MSKDLKDKAIKIKGKDYVQVKDRIIYLSEEVKNYSVETDYTYFPEEKMWVVKATLTTPKGKYTGLAQEIYSAEYGKVNNSSALENAETSAVGRACAMAGIGVLDSIASVDEITKATNRRPTQEPQQLVKTGKCSICGEQGIVGKFGAYCPNYQDVNHKGKPKPTFNIPPNFTLQEKTFIASLPEEKDENGIPIVRDNGKKYNSNNCLI